MAGSSMVGLNLTGDAELMRVLNRLPGSVVKGGLRTASRKAYTPIRKSAKEKAEQHRLAKGEKDSYGYNFTRWDEIIKAIVIHQKTYSRKGIIYTGVGLRDKKVSGERTGHADLNPGKLAHLLEFGTAPHAIGEYMHPGASPRPFLRPAWDQHKGKAVQVMASTLRPALEQAAQREARRRMKKYGHA